MICLEQAQKQAEEYGHSQMREIVYLYVHSVLHLLGYDHMEESDKVQMRQREELSHGCFRFEKERIDGTEKHS